MKKLNVKKIALCGVMSALVFACSWLQIQLVNEARVHFGNAMCVLSGLLLGGLYGGLSAGIGSFMFDLTNPLYISSAPFTFVFKFLLGFIAGKIAHSGGRLGQHTVPNIVGATLGSAAYIALYLSKKFAESVIVQLLTPEAAIIRIAPNMVSSLINGAAAVIVAVPLAAGINAALKRGKITLV